MSRVCTYLNFTGQAEEAFEFYASVFHTQYESPLVRVRDVPGPSPANEEESALVLHVALPILAGHVIMGSDVLASMGHVRVGNNTTIVLETDSRDQADEFYRALSAGGSDREDMADRSWGAYWGVCLDRFGVRWMISHTPEAT